MRFDLFADGIANVSIATGVVRIDFYVTRPPVPSGNSGMSSDAEREIHLSVNLPLPSFVSSINVLQRVTNELVQRGVITAAPPPAQAPPAAL